ncbi:MAG: tetratricopeptide (TPR) repeat protein [Planctomycetota bacterium]|jgi:tetratricopeptide (TPR) repeat protein
MSHTPSEVGRLYERFLAQFLNGGAVPFDGWVLDYEQYRDELQQLEDTRRAASAQVDDLFPGHIPPNADSLFRPGHGKFEVPPANFPKQLKPGMILGDFKLLSVIGSGGMGCVWEAEETKLKRRVALKVILPGFQIDSKIDLLEREARAGARLSHEGLVRVYGHGETDGVHWINQELVQGGWTLRDFIDEMNSVQDLPEDYYRRVTTLGVQLARALGAAHDEGILHRDIKPQNILIGPKDQPKVTDFGLARILDESAIGETGRMLGTVLYMSPEQAEGRNSAIDQRSDLFSLGIVLYELLALQRPFDGDTQAQVLLKVRKEEPESLNRRRSRLPMDLALVVHKALEKKPEDRYQSMGELGDDLQRHLDHWPVQAKAPGPLRKARKWARRNPAPTAAGAVGVVALVALSGMLYKYLEKNEALTNQTVIVSQRTEDLRSSYVDLEQSNARVVEERNRLQKVVEFNQGFFERLEPSIFGRNIQLDLEHQLVERLTRGGSQESEVLAALAEMRELHVPINFSDVGVHALRDEVLAPALRVASLEFVADPNTQARLQDSVARAYERLGLMTDARDVRHSIMEVLRSSLGEDAEGTIRAISLMDISLSYLKERELQKHYLDEALEKSLRVLGPDSPTYLQCLHNLGQYLFDVGQFDQSEEVLTAAVSSRVRVLGPMDAQTLVSKDSLAWTLMSLGSNQKAKAIFQDVLEVQKELVGDHGLGTLLSMQNLARANQSLFQLEEALALQHRVLLEMRAQFGNEHPHTIYSITLLASILFFDGDFTASIDLQREAVFGLRKTLGATNPTFHKLLSDIADLFNLWGQDEEATAHYAELVTGLSQSLGREHDQSQEARLKHAGSLVKRGHLGEALAILKLAQGLALENLGTESDLRERIRADLVDCYERLLVEGPNEDYSRALEALLEADK